MLISFTGTASSGKTTLLNAFKEQYPDWVIVPELTRELKKQGFIINDDEDNYDETQDAITNLHLNTLNKYQLDNKNYALDRCLFDGYIYTHYLYSQKKVSREVLNRAFHALLRRYHEYDIVFYPDPHEVELKYDGVRSNSHSFRNNIIKLYEQLVLDKYTNVVVIKGNTQQRMEQISKLITHGK